jgi:hypothetical protein
MASKLRGKPHEPIEAQRQAADQFLATQESACNRIVAMEERAFAPAPVPESIANRSSAKLHLALQQIEMARRARLPRASRYHKEHQECLDAIAELRKEHPTLELRSIRRLMLNKFPHVNSRTVANWVRSALDDSVRN